MKSQKCPGCKYRRYLSGTQFGKRIKACHYSIDTDYLRGCSAKECFEKKVHFDSSAYANPYQQKAAVMGRSGIKVVELDMQGRALRMYQSITQAASAQGITVPAMRDRIRRKTIKDGKRWITNGGRT